MTVQPEAPQPEMSPDRRDRPRRPALSPSRAADFKQCPLLYRFRAIDRLPEAPSAAQLRGSVVHAALEQLYGLPAALRGPETAMSLVEPAWDQVIAAEPDLAGELDPAQRTATAGRGPRVALRLLPARRPDPLRPAVLRTARGGRTRRRHAAARASSTGSTSPPPASCGWSTTRPARRRRPRGRWPSSRRCSR